MGKSQQNQSQSMANQNYNTASGDESMMQNNILGMGSVDLQQAQATGQQEQGAAQNYDESTMTSGMGAYNPGTYNALSGQINQNIQTGGYNNPQQLQQLQGDIGTDVSTGGYNEAQVQQMEAGGLGGVSAPTQAQLEGGYSGLINTGGISDATATAMQDQAQSAVQGTYASLGQQLAQQNAAQGNVAGGETAEMARQEAQAASQSVTNTNATIGQLRQQGTEAGLSGLGGLSTTEAGLTQGLMTSQAQQEEAGVNQEANLAASQQQGTLASTNAESTLATNAAQQQLQAAGSLQSLYASAPGAAGQLVQEALQNQQVGGTLTSQQAQIMAELSKNPGLFSDIMQGLGAVSGAASGLMGLGG